MIEDCLYLGADVLPKQVLEMFMDNTGREIKHSENVFSSGIDNLFIVDARLIDEEGKRFAPGVLLFEPNVRLYFVLKKGNDPVKAQETIFSLLLNVIQKTNWDIALLHGCDDLVLVRRSGKLNLQQGNEFWTSDRLKLIPVPYQMSLPPNL
jgi:hypothetical protein